MHQAILLPGSILPKELAYGDLVQALGDPVRAIPKDLEVYAGDAPPAGYGLELEIEGVLQAADSSGFGRFHLTGYSGGGAVALAFASRFPERLLSLALLEPAWMGNGEMSADERALWSEFEQLEELPPERFMPEFVRLQLAPGVEPPAPPPGPPPPWMALRPAGIRALMDAFTDFDLDLDALRGFQQPVYFALGELSNPRWYGRMAERARNIFGDFTLDVFKDRHHLDPPHRAEPEILANRLKDIWRRAEARVRA
jgi:pimeloyl-ACP methyl ester carboxylesterase